MEITFLHPLYLMALFAIPLMWFLPQRVMYGRHGMLRSMVMALIVIALARPVLLIPRNETFQVFVVDRSASISVEQLERANDILQTLIDRVPVRQKKSLIVIGHRGPAEDEEGLAGTTYVSGASESSLSTALEAAAQTIPAGTGGVVTLISDGLATDRRWSAVVQSLVKRGIPVNTYDLGLRSGDIYPSAINPDGDLRVGQTARVRVDVIGTATGLQVRLSDPDRELAVSAPFDSEDRASVVLEFEPEDAGFMDLTADLIVRDAQSQDRDPDNNTITKVVAVQDALQVLYIGDRQQGGAAKLADLAGRGFQVVDADAQMLDANFPLDRYKLVFLDDRPAEKLPGDFQEHLIEAVKSKGLGLFYSGGRAAFGSGGYFETEIAAALPVDIEKRSERSDPSASLAVIIDTSSSMSSRQRMELAKHVARLAVSRLQPQDWIGVVEFYGAKHWAVPMQAVTDKNEIYKAISQLQPFGGSGILYQAVEEAYYGLKNRQTQYKHILVISDAGADVRRADFENMARRLARNNINLSTVLVGAGDFDQNMVDMAAWGKGRFYSVKDRFELVDLILKQPSTRKLHSYRTGNFALVSRGGSGWWQGVDRTRIPPLTGYVETKTRPGAEVLIEKKTASQPILATWRYGLGRVTSLMTEPLGAGTRAWREWRDYGAVLGRVLSRTASDVEAFQFGIVRDGHGARVIARRSGRDDAVQPEALLLNEGAGRSIAFRERAPGFFEAKLVADIDEHVRILAGVSGEPSAVRRRLVSMAGEDIFPELQVDPLRGLDLVRLSRATGGQALGATAPLMTNGDVNGDRVSLALKRLWPLILFLALLTYLGELIYRRLPGARSHGPINT